MAIVDKTVDRTELQGLLDELVAKHNVPGAAVAVLEHGEVTEAAAGVLNTNTGVPATADSVFVIGSATKPITATLVMQLVDEGKVELDQPFRRYVRDFKVADPEATATITVRQLLCHSSGVHGDHIEDTGRGDDCLEKYLAECAIMRQIAPPGKLFSYFNAGYVLLGLLVERITGRTWDSALKERITAPLGMDRTVTLPEEAIMFSAAVGHVHAPNNSRKLIPAQNWGWPRSTGPCGGIVSTARDLITFARLHLDGGTGRDDRELLSEESVKAMQCVEIESPNTWEANACGLGWMLYDWNGHKIIGHDGNGYGRRASLRIAPDSQLAVSLLTNAYPGSSLAHDLFTQLFADRAGIDARELPAEADGPVDFDPSLYAGTYRTPYQEARIELRDQALVANIDFIGAVNEPSVSALRGVALRPIDETSFLMRNPASGDETVVTFFDFDKSGRPRYYHRGKRAVPRVGD